MGRLAGLLALLGMAVAFVIGVGIALVVLDARETNAVVRTWLDVARWLTEPFRGLFDLERARPELLIRWRDPRTAPEDNASGESSGVTLLDDYLRATFRPVARFGTYEVHERGGT